MQKQDDAYTAWIKEMQEKTAKAMAKPQRPSKNDVGAKVYVELNKGNRVPAVVLETAPSSEGDYCGFSQFHSQMDQIKVRYSSDVALFSHKYFPTYAGGFQRLKTDTFSHVKFRIGGLEPLYRPTKIYMRKALC